MAKNNFYLLLFLFIMSCAGKEESTTTSAPATTPDLAGFTLQDISGTSFQKATKLDASNVLIEEGQLHNGKRTGAWISFYPKDGRVKSIVQYLNGKKNGLYLEMNDRGSVDLQANYTDDVLTGKWVKYKFGSKPEKEINYNSAGKLDGAYREFHNNGKMLKEIYYKNGVQDGKFRQFNDKEQVIMEYDYKDGEKISGGIVKPPAE